MTGQLDVRARVEVDASRAVSPLRLTRDELKRTTEAMRESATTATAASRQTVAALERQGQAAAAAARQLTSAAGSTRAAYQQLGFQISDVAAQASAGVRPLQIFAQQGGQVAFALSQFGGGLGRVGAFLAGPWGAALLAGGLALSAFLERTRTAEDGVNALSAALDRLAERKLSAGQQRAEDIGLVQIELARLEGRAAALQTRAEGPATGGRRGVQARILARQELAAVETEIAGLQAVLRVQEQVAAAVDRAKRAQEAGAAAARAAGAAAQEAAQRAATAAREAARAEAERVRQYEALARAAREAGAALQRVIPSSLIEAFEIGQRRQRGFTFADDPLREAVGGIEARRSAADRLEEARQLGAQQAREASREMLRQAGAIGAALGGRAGR
ncbi:MAG: phage tail length tape measure family protein, partial [Sphingomonadaceae bacterium]